MTRDSTWGRAGHVLLLTFLYAMAETLIVPLAALQLIVALTSGRPSGTLQRVIAFLDLRQRRLRVPGRLARPACRCRDLRAAVRSATKEPSP